MFGILLLFVGIGAFCALLYNAAVYALPVVIGLWVGFAALHLGAGPILSFAIGCIAGGMVYGIGVVVFERSHSIVLRLAVAIIFVAPAVYVGYSSTLQLSALVMPPDIWQHVLALVDAVAVGSTAFIRLVGAQRMSVHLKTFDN